MSLRHFYCLSPRGMALLADPSGISPPRARTTAVHQVRGL